MSAFLQNSQTGEVLPLSDNTVIGRSQEASVILADSSISRAHCVIRRQGESFWIQDLGSANGTMVNDLYATTAQKLVDGDEIQLGFMNFLFVQPNDREGSGSGEGGSEGAATQVLKREERAVKTTTATLLVGDLAEFTNLSSRIGAEDIAELATRWYEACRTILSERGAHIDKFIGDCVFAYWPETDVETRELALESARELRASRVDDSSTRRMIVERSNARVDCRVGLHIGDVALAGSQGVTFTVLGDAANVAFRVESMTRKLQAGILATGAFLSDWEEGRVHFRSRGFQKLKGLEQEHELFEFVDANGSSMKE